MEVRFEEPVTERRAQGAGRQPTVTRAFTRIEGDRAEAQTSAIAEETPVALVYRKRTHAVMMATPADLEDFATGFTISERIVRDASQIESIDVVRHDNGVDINISVPEAVVASLADRARAMAGRTGCGLCGVEAIDDAVRTPSVITSNTVFDVGALWRASESLDAMQVLNRDTHAIHGAAWADATGELRIVREDIGRHNALDKVLGALIRERIDATNGFVVVTSRASFELVQKTAELGIPLLAAVSRPTGLAIRIAEEGGMCLVGLLRGRTANVYAHAERLSL